MKHDTWNTFPYKALRFLAGPFVRRMLHFGGSVDKSISSPTLILANHTTDYDPILVGLSFSTPLRFVASEHVLRFSGLSSRFIKTVFAPIPRVKGGTGAGTVAQVLRLLKRGASVCIFPEGTRTHTGRTLFIPASTGKLVKASGATLITYRFTGGYLTSPQWSSSLRKGRMDGGVVGRYDKEVLRALKAEEIEAIIARDLYEDAYARQAAFPVAYRGKRLAENIELALYCCPLCKQIGTIKSEGDAFHCACGLNARYTAQGMLEGAPFQTIPQWDDWQAGHLHSLAAGAQFSLTDEGESLCLVEPCKSSTCIARGTLRMDKDALTCGAYAFALSAMEDLAICGRNTLTFSTLDGKHYELKSEYPRSALKYLALYQYVRKKVGIWTIHPQTLGCGASSYNLA